VVTRGFTLVLETNCIRQPASQLALIFSCTDNLGEHLQGHQNYISKVAMETYLYLMLPNFSDSDQQKL